MFLTRNFRSKVRQGSKKSRKNRRKSKVGRRKSRRIGRKSRRIGRKSRRVGRKSRRIKGGDDDDADEAGDDNEKIKQLAILLDSHDEAKKAVKKEKVLRQELLEAEAEERRLDALLAEVEKTFARLADENKQRHPLGYIYDDQFNLDHDDKKVFTKDQYDIFYDLENDPHPLG